MPTATGQWAAHAQNSGGARRVYRDDLIAGSTCLIWGRWQARYWGAISKMREQKLPGEKEKVLAGRCRGPLQPLQRTRPTSQVQLQGRIESE
jgi:hypothetical protein